MEWMFATFLLYATHLLLHYSWDCLTATTAQENAGTNLY